MKRYVLALGILCLLPTLTGCGSLLSNQRPWPDGASVSIGEFNVQASMSGAGSIIMRDVKWTGTNGFPIPGTNAAPTSIK